MVHLLWCLSLALPLVCQEHPHPRLQGVSSGPIAKSPRAANSWGHRELLASCTAFLSEPWSMMAEPSVMLINHDSVHFIVFCCVKTETHWMKKMCLFLRYFFCHLIFLSRLDCASCLNILYFFSCVFCLFLFIMIIKALNDRSGGELVN